VGDDGNFGAHFWKAPDRAFSHPPCLNNQTRRTPTKQPPLRCFPTSLGRHHGALASMGLGVGGEVATPLPPPPPPPPLISASAPPPAPGYCRIARLWLSLGYRGNARIPAGPAWPQEKQMMRGQVWIGRCFWAWTRWSIRVHSGCDVGQSRYLFQLPGANDISRRRGVGPAEAGRGAEINSRSRAPRG